MGEKANILVLGTSGAGKSTLINAVIGKEVAKVGFGKHGTEKMEPYVSDDLNFQLIDSRGFEYNFFNTKKAVKDMKSWMKSGLKDKKPRIHMLWFCVDATSRRFTKTTFKTVEEVKKEWPDIPIIVVLTKSFFSAEDEENIEMVKETFCKVSKKTGMPKAVIPVLAQAPKGEDILPRGIEELIRVTEDNLEEAVRDSDEAVKKYDLKCKRMKSQALTIAAATSGGVVGAIPIDFPDAVILTPLETALITGIAKIYKLDKSEDFTKKIITRVVEAGTVSMVAKTAINQLKLIPGIANLAADVLNAIVAGAIVLGIGEAASLVMEKVYVGDVKTEDLDWINKIVESQMGAIVKKLSEVIDKQNGKIVVKDVLKALFNTNTEVSPVK
ncbi:MAG: GTPase [Anaerobutyricum hallii]